MVSEWRRPQIMAPRSPLPMGSASVQCFPPSSLNLIFKSELLCASASIAATLQLLLPPRVTDKVKDMMDLESVHMEYLADSLCICFLSDETKGVGSIIESILQCALDFRSCITFGAWDSEDLSGKLSKINISQ